MSQKESRLKPRNGPINQSLITKEHQCRGFGEVAGGTTAAFAALCCCPCGLVHLAALAFVKLPAGLCKKTVKKIRRKLKVKKRVPDKPGHGKQENVCDESFRLTSPRDLLSSIDPFDLVKVQTAVTRLSTEECWKEITGKSYVGFWRNHSSRE